MRTSVSAFRFTLRFIVASLAAAVAIAGWSAETAPDLLTILEVMKPRPALLSQEKRHELDSPRDAVEWRAATMLDEHGKLPPGAVYRANLQRRNSVHAHSTTGRIATTAQSISPSRWVFRGPSNVGGRTNALLVNPANSQILYAGAAGGGVWKSTDGGNSWAQLTDFLSNLTVGAMVLDPLDPNTIYVGTGERPVDLNALQGAGVFMSTDAGAHWTQMPGTQTWTFVSSLAANPGRSGELLAATDSGIWRLSNGTWSKVYTPSDAVGHGICVAFDPRNGINGTDHAVASVFTFDGSFYRNVLLYSNTGGASFPVTAQLPNGLNSNNWSTGQFPKDDATLVYAPSQSNIVYVTVGYGGTKFDEGFELWKSSDGGMTYGYVSAAIGTCANRHCAMWVAPDNPDVIVSGGVDVYRNTATDDKSFTKISNGFILTPDPHSDLHCVVADPAYDGVNNKTVYVCTDGGVFRTTDIINASAGTNSWTPLVNGYETAQYYDAAADLSSNGAFIGGLQDNGTLLTKIGTTVAQEVFDGDGGFCVIDPNNPLTMYVTTNYLTIKRSTDGGASSCVAVSTPNCTLLNTPESGGNTNFEAPIALDPNDPTTLYAGAQNLWRLKNANTVIASQCPAGTITQCWKSLPRDSVNDPATKYANVSAFAIAAGKPDVIWIGLDDLTQTPYTYFVRMTTNGTSDSPQWAAPTGASQLPARYVNCILIDPSDPNTVYIAFGGYTNANLWRTTDGGSTWTSLGGNPNAGGLPDAPVRWVARHPRNAQRLYAATDVGIYESEDAGATWTTQQQGPADVSVNTLKWVNNPVHTNEYLVAATHGRGMWTADVTSVPTLAPANLVATASGTTSVGLTWTGVTGAQSYRILRGSGGSAYAVVGTATSASYSETVNSGTTYLYKVQALLDGVYTIPSNIDLATTVVFTDDNNLYHKPIAANYLQEVRAAVNDVRVAAGLSALTFSKPAQYGQPVASTDINELRTGLHDAYQAIGMAPPTFAETLYNGWPIKGSHVQEIRNAVK